MRAKRGRQGNLDVGVLGDMPPCDGLKTAIVVAGGLFIGFLMGVFFIGGGFFLHHPVFDIYWGPVIWFLDVGFTVPTFILTLCIWWATLFFVACRQYRKVATMLYLMQIISAPLARYLNDSEALFYLKYWYHPSLWAYWFPMIAFTIWYFTQTFGISWKAHFRMVLTRLIMRRERISK